ncbi:MAG: helix-turn-helix transcriptional regulator [Ktedonobacteraceae bacterium]|nr:helix-turn-helix transcriptional regulator [Ktedonobacteraceae bacterium]
MDSEGPLFAARRPLALYAAQTPGRGEYPEDGDTDAAEVGKGGLVTRTVYPTSPPTVEYTLTPLGEMLRAAFQELLQWARVYTTQFQPMRESDAEADEEEGFHKK